MADKKFVEEALGKLKINEEFHNVKKSSLTPKDIKKKFDSHIGFEKEKDKFADYVYLYLETGGNFRPYKEVTCYVGAPGTGKTSFVRALSKVTGRPIEIISCAGLKDFKDYSILGSKDKPSLIAWTFEKNKCKNPIILFDELEKVEEGSEIQKDLIKLFNIYKNEKGEENKELSDAYYDINIELDHISFFATVNYSENLAPLLKKNVTMYSLEDYKPEEKVKILNLKKAEIEKSIQAIYGREAKNFIPDELIEELPNYIKEDGIRQSERVLFKIGEEYIFAKEKGQDFKIENSKQWLKNNALPYQEKFRSNNKHYFLYFLWVIIWILLLTIIIKKIILSEKKLEQQIN
ncbi:MAG: Lon protease [Mycoplasmataceae bacterium]|nr:MAG: Lon protease [Mycoplasmataceae bacterium]